MTVRSGKIVRYYVVFLTLNEGVCIHKTPGMKKACKTSGLNRWQQGNCQVHRGKSRLAGSLCEGVLAYRPRINEKGANGDTPLI